MNKIEVFDDFLSEEMYIKCLEELQKPKWTFLSGHHQIWHMGSLDQVPFFNIAFKKKVLEILPKDINWTHYDMYANGQSRGQDGSIHQDQKMLNDALSLVYFSTPEWSPHYEGNLFFYNQDELTQEYNIIDMVEYKSNRAVLFPGHVWHKASAPTMIYPGLRTSVVVKLIDGDDEDLAKFQIGLETK